MSRRFRDVNKRFVMVLCAAAFSLSLVAGCAGGPNQKERAALEEQRMAVEAAEKMAADKKAEKARLERKLAEKKAEKKGLEDKLAATKANLASSGGE